MRCKIQEKRTERGAGPTNEFLFAVFLVFVLIALVSGLFIPKSARADNLNRLRWEAPPALVADVLMSETVDGRVGDTRCLKARTDVLEETSGVDRKRRVEEIRSFAATSADQVGANRRSPD